MEVMIKEASKILGLPKETIRNYVCKGKINASKKEGVKYLFFDKDYLMFLKNKGRYGQDVNQEWDEYLINKEIED